MLKNYIKIAFRNLIKNKIFTLINVLGLAVAFASSFYILIYVVNEFSYDDYNVKKDKIYRINTNIESFNSIDPLCAYILGDLLKDDNITGIEKFCRTSKVVGIKLKDRNNFLNKANIKACDQSIFDILTLPILKGTNDISNKNSIVISEKISKYFFGKKNPIGKIIEAIIETEIFALKVSGVMKDIPKNSTFSADIICNLDLSVKGYTALKNPAVVGTIDHRTSWYSVYWNTYLLLDQNVNSDEIEKILNKYPKKYLGKNDFRISYQLQNLKDVYTKSTHIPQSNPQEDIRNIYLYLIIGIFILLIAVSNYIILSSALSDNRYKEIGIRKLSGATKKNIIYQILGESLLVVLFSLIISALIIEFTHTFAQELFNYNFSFYENNRGQYIIGFLIIAMLVAFISSAYLGIYLSSIEIATIFKSRIFKPNKGFIRKAIILGQLFIFLILTFSAVTLYNQNKFLVDKDLGFDSKNLIFINYNYEKFSKAESYLNEIKNNSNIISTTLSNTNFPTNSIGGSLVKRYDDPTKRVKCRELSVEKDFVKTMGLKLLEGEDVTKNYDVNDNYVLLNEKALIELNIKKPIGKKFLKWTIGGVIKDFNFNSLHNEVSPLFIYKGKNQYFNTLIIKYKENSLKSTLEFLKDKWESMSGGLPFNYELIEDKVSELYKKEETLHNITTFFTILAIIIGASGFFGLTLFTLKKRTKEIGIRRVLGATSSNLVYILSKEFLILIGIASVISFPIGYYFMNKWLQNFAYRTDIGVVSFALTFIIVLMIVGFSISLLVMKSVRTNPVESLRDE